MATVTPRKTQDGRVTYQAKVRLKGYPTTTSTFTRLTDARRWASQTETQIREGRFFTSTESRKRSVADLVDRYLADVLPAKKDTTVPERQLKWWKDRIGHLMLASVTPAVLAEARDTLLRNPVDWSRSKRKGTTFRSPATVNRYLAAISQPSRSRFGIGSGWNRIPCPASPRARKPVVGCATWKIMNA